MNEEMRSATPVEDIRKLIEGGNYLVGMVLDDRDDDAVTEYAFENTPETIANFLGAHLGAAQITVLTPWDKPVLSAFGDFLDQVFVAGYREKILEYLLPIQLGEAEPKPIVCPTMDEVDEVFDYRA